MSANQKPQGQTQRPSPVRSSAFGIPKFITQKSPAKNLRTVSDGRRCRYKWNVPTKHAKHTKRICVHLRVSAVNNPSLNSTCAHRRTSRLRHAGPTASDCQPRRDPGVACSRYVGRCHITLNPPEHLQKSLNVTSQS